MSRLQQRFASGRAACYFFGALLSCAFFSQSARGGPIPAAPLGLGTVAGESDLPSFIFPGASEVSIDWMVVRQPNADPGPLDDTWAYLYQIENTSAVALDAMSLTWDFGTAATILAAGAIAGDDLDVATAFHPAHAAAVAPLDDVVPGPFPGLAGEEGPFPLVPLIALLTTVNPVDDNISWTFAPQAAGTESITLAYISTKPPKYGFGVLQDSTPPSPWGSLAPGGEPLPIPDPLFLIPEPSSAVLLALGCMVAVLFYRRRKS